SLENDNCTGVNLSGGSPTCTFDMRFSPATTGVVETPIRVRCLGIDSQNFARYVYKNAVLKASVTAQAQNLIAPQPVQPANGSVNIKNGALLIWKNGSDTSGSATTHEVTICADANFTNCNPIAVAHLPETARDTLWGFIPLLLII